VSSPFGREEFVTVPGVHAPMGRYAHAVRSGGVVYVSGCGPFDAEGRLDGDDIAAQCRRVLRNAAAILAAAGSSPDRVVHETVYLADVSEASATRPVRAEFYGGVLPASTLVGAGGLTDGRMRVEIDLVATVPFSRRLLASVRLRTVT
jgi:2-iminobutanoate/2-iminopropanoate deaminase